MNGHSQTSALKVGRRWCSSQVLVVPLRNGLGCCPVGAAIRKVASPEVAEGTPTFRRKGGHLPRGSGSGFEEKPTFGRFLERARGATNASRERLCSGVRGKVDVQIWGPSEDLLLAWNFPRRVIALLLTRIVKPH